MSNGDKATAAIGLSFRDYLKSTDVGSFGAVTGLTYKGVLKEYEAQRSMSCYANQ